MTVVSDRPTRTHRLIHRRVVVALVATTVLLLLNAFAVRVFSVPSASMEPGLQPGDRLVVDETARLRPYQRGEVVVFKDPGGWVDQNDLFAAPGGIGLAAPNPVQQTLSALGLPGSGDTYLVKRIIGLPGDRVASDAGGQVTVNGRVISEPYLPPRTAGSRTAFSVTVPAGRLWVMGDNREMSSDSRYQTETPSHGFVPESDVVGRVIAVAWPLPRVRAVG